MTTNRIQRTIRMSVLSTFLALVAFSFLAFGTASAHTRSAAQTASSTTATVSRIIVNRQGATVFNPSAITVKSGTPVRIVNKTAFSRILFVGGSIVRLASGASMTIFPSQSMGVGICGGGSLSITVV